MRDAKNTEKKKDIRPRQREMRRFPETRCNKQASERPYIHTQRKRRRENDILSPYAASGTHVIFIYVPKDSWNEKEQTSFRDQEKPCLHAFFSKGWYVQKKRCKLMRESIYWFPILTIFGRIKFWLVCVSLFLSKENQGYSSSPQFASNVAKIESPGQRVRKNPLLEGPCKHKPLICKKSKKPRGR